MPSRWNAILLLVGGQSSTLARQADLQSQFLYLFEASSRDVIIEYQKDMPAPAHHDELMDGGADGGLALDEIHSNDEGDEKPFFLRENYPISRVVEYYNPWCAHCQQFVSQYIATARDILRVDGVRRNRVEFFSISCTIHEHLCKDEKVFGYPTLRAYPASSTDFFTLKVFTKKSLDDALNLGIVDYGENESMLGDQQLEQLLDTTDSSNIEVGRKDAYQRTRTDVYIDAALSLTHALENSIYINNANEQTPLTKEQSEALSEWIDLLYWTLPPTWMLHTLITDVKHNMEDIVTSKNFLLEIVNKNRDVVNDSGSSWSNTCRQQESHQNGRGAYSCGMWSLLHIMSVGVSERHAAVLGGRDRVSMQHAAETLKDYILHFFDNWCPECNDYFTDMYQKCSFNRCKRFQPQRHHSKQQQPPEKYWQEFPLWLWQVHNDVNEKVIKDDIQQRYGRAATTTELESVRWPSQTACPACQKSGRWNEEKVFLYLKKEYWPGGIQNFRFVVLDKKESPNSNDDMNGLIFRSKWAYLLVVVFMGLSTAAWNFWKRRQLMITGRHKKVEANFV